VDLFQGLGFSGVTAYRERPVHPGLARHVVCTWIDPGRAGRHAVLPDACIDLVWDGAEVAVAGPDTEAWSITSGDTFVGIRFRPGAAPGFLGVPASELLDRTVPLREFWGRAADDLAAALADNPAAAERVFENALLQRRAAAPPIDTLVEHVVHELGRGRVGGPAVVDLLAEQCAVSPRSLHRRCVAALGYGPKMLDRVVRFRRALGLLQSPMALIDVAFGAGYADQAHLTNELRRLAHATPGELKRGRALVLSANGI
jgi:AraC-like DNA-binding protein